MFGYDLKGATSVATALKAQSITGTVNGPAVDLRPYRGKVVLILNSAAGTGTTPTLDLKVQDSADGSTGWADLLSASEVGLFTQVTTTDSLQAVMVDTEYVRGFVRVVTTIGGTSSPTFIAGVSLIGFPQRVS